MNSKNTNLTQKQIVTQLFAFSELTMFEVAKYSGIERANICRYVAQLLRQKRIACKGKRICTISGEIAKVWRIVA